MLVPRRYQTNYADWVHRDHLVCRLTDRGHLSDPLTGRVPVSAHAPDGGRGRLLVNQLCDLVRVHTTPVGTSTRIHPQRG
ncbi:ATP-binding protein [Catellatospora tritici]|uniref:ATP-binding protein n=1 Tax=Catellatospora tritici TaxID=2851566 RepID=UPI00355908CA